MKNRKEALAVLGTDEKAVAFAVEAARANVPIAGVHDPDHRLALLASLRIGCCAFPDPAEACATARWILLGEGFEPGSLSFESEQAVFSLDSVNTELLARMRRV